MKWAHQAQAQGPEKPEKGVPHPEPLYFQVMKVLSESHRSQLHKAK